MMPRASQGPRDESVRARKAARALGFHGIRFTEPESLRAALAELEVL